MCKYCQNDFEKVETLRSTSLDGELESAHVTLEIMEKQSLYMKAYCWDKLRATYIGMATSFNINYCPWCGRKLTND